MGSRVRGRPAVRMWQRVVRAAGQKRIHGRTPQIAVRQVGRLERLGRAPSSTTVPSY